MTNKPIILAGTCFPNTEPIFHGATRSSYRDTGIWLAGTLRSITGTIEYVGTYSKNTPQILPLGNGQ